MILEPDDIEASIQTFIAAGAVNEADTIVAEALSGRSSLQRSRPIGPPPATAVGVAPGQAGRRRRARCDGPSPAS